MREPLLDIGQCSDPSVRVFQSFASFGENEQGRMSGTRMEGKSESALDTEFNPLVGMGRDGFERVCETNRELLEFWCDRIECVEESAQRMLSCRSIEEMQQVHARYLQDMLQAHAAMWSKLPGLFFMRPTSPKTDTAVVRSPRAA
jgi:hypothetical protein